VATSPRWTWARWGALVVGLVVVVLGAVTVHVERLGEEALAASDAAAASGDTSTAIARAREAAMAEYPGSPLPTEAFTRLTAIAEAAESRGDFERAQMAWRAIRIAVRTTRTEAREAARMDQAGKALVRLSARTCEGNQSRPPAACAAATEAALATDDLPPLGGFVWLGLGALAFLGGSAAALGATKPKARVVWAVVGAAGLALATIATAVR